MKDLSFTQEFTLCVLDKIRPRLIFSDYRYSAFIVFSAFIELILSDAITINENREIIILKNQDFKDEYLKIVFNDLKSKKIQTLEKWIEFYIFKLSRKPIKQIIHSIINSLIENKYVNLEVKERIFKKNIYHTDKNQINSIINRIKNEFLNGGVLTDNTTILAGILYHSNMIKRYMSQEEIDELKFRLKKLNNNDKNSKISSVMKEISKFYIIIVTMNINS